jgi:hypothetical protein
MDVMAGRYAEDTKDLAKALNNGNERGLREKMSELNGDHAGIKVGTILGQLMDGTKSAEEAFKEIKTSSVIIDGAGQVSAREVD